jgi:hypothetical protein
MEHWRRTRKSKKPMPPELWRAAVAVACEHGVFAVSRELRLNYNVLKARTKEKAAAAERGAPPPAFVELPVSASQAPQAMLEVELVHADGDRMLMRLAVGQAAEAAALVRAFRSRER